MNKEELREKRNRTIETLDDIKAVLGLDELYIDELEEKISVLLSCKNCPENKGGLICQKEYEDKCLAQKIQYIKELQEENAELKADNDARKFAMAMSEKVEKQLREENAELRKIAEFQQSSNMSRHFENKKIKEVLAVGSMWNKHLNSQNKALEEERDKYRDMTFDQRKQLTNAKELLKRWLRLYNTNTLKGIIADTEQFISEVEK